jgi:hypothetical protein
MRKARIIMMARTESRVACSTSAWSMAVPVWAALASAFAWTFFSTAFSTVAQSPSSAETRSFFGDSGQFERCQDAPWAAFFTSSGLSSSALKKARHSSFTEAGSS